jgi:hypothetical protein
LRWLKKLAISLVTFVLGIAAFMAFDVLTPNFDVLQSNPDQVSISMTFESFALGEDCPATAWTLSPNIGSPITGEVPKKKKENTDNPLPRCTGLSSQMVTKGNAWALTHQSVI